MTPADIVTSSGTQHLPGGVPESYLVLVVHFRAYILHIRKYIDTEELHAT